MLRTHRGSRASGFSLIELLVVIAIIALVIAIIVPALGGARTAAKKTATSQLLTQIMDGALAFSQDNGGRMPGYFLPTQMGSPMNMSQANGGFTGMENVLLDLIGQNAITGAGGLMGGSGNGRLIGPGKSGKGDSNIKVDFDLLGTGDGVYLHGLENYLEVASGQYAAKSHQEFPDLVDAFGNPILAWVEDPAAPREPTSLEDFAQTDSREGSARFYWASNYGWLMSNSLGKGGKDQTNGLTGSLLNDPDYAPETLSAALGNPNFHLPADLDSTNENAVWPAASRGAIVIHSAGADGVFFGKKDSGAKAIGVNDAQGFKYGLNFFTNGSRRTDSNGVVTSIDITRGFDDMLTAGGN